MHFKDTHVGLKVRFIIHVINEMESFKVLPKRFLIQVKYICYKSFNDFSQLENIPPKAHSKIL